MQTLPPMNSLKAFEAAASKESFIKAGNDLNVSPSAISHQIKKLEDYLNKQLFVRESQGVKLTQDGRKLYRVVSASFNAIRKELYAEQSYVSGSLSITVAPSFASGWLIPKIKDFRKKHPNIEIKIDSSFETKDLNNKEIDAAIRHTKEVTDDNSSFIKLFSEKLQIVCSPNTGRRLKSIKDLSHETLIFSGSSPDDWKKIFTKHEMKNLGKVKKIHFSNDTSAVEAAINGAGIAITHDKISSELIADKKLTTPFEIELISEYAYYLIYKNNNLKNDVFIAFKNWITELLKK